MVRMKMSPKVRICPCKLLRENGSNRRVLMKALVPASQDLEYQRTPDNPLIHLYNRIAINPSSVVMVQMEIAGTLPTPTGSCTQQHTR
jgi:hypothetical protein